MPDPTSLTVQLERGASTTALFYPSQRESMATFILAHGAGQRSPFMVDAPKHGELSTKHLFAKPRFESCTLPG